MIRVVLPAHLRTLARVSGEIEVEVAPPVTLAAVVAAVEDRFPTLRGTIRDHATKKRRAYVRYFVCGEDVSHAPPETRVPPAVVNGEEPFLILGAMSGG